jgi:hypothetical protein
MSGGGGGVMAKAGENVNGYFNGGINGVMKEIISWRGGVSAYRRGGGWQAVAKRARAKWRWRKVSE